MNESSATNMEKNLDKHWFFEQLAKEAFRIFSIAWGVLFFLEILKTGIVSNYLSLSHAALPVMLVGILWLVLLPEQEQVIKEKKKTIPLKTLVLISLVLVFLLFFLLETGFFLTLLIIFATLAGLWGAALAFVSQ